MGKEFINDDVLKGVSGGTSEADKSIDTSFSSFKKAWKEMGFAKQDRTEHELEAIYDEWELTGFNGSAAEFLSRYK